MQTVRESNGGEMSRRIEVQRKREQSGKEKRDKKREGRNNWGGKEGEERKRTGEREARKDRGRKGGQEKLKGERERPLNVFEEQRNIQSET